MNLRSPSWRLPLGVAVVALAVGPLWGAACATAHPGAVGGGGGATQSASAGGSGGGTNPTTGQGGSGQSTAAPTSVASSSGTGSSTTNSSTTSTTSSSTASTTSSSTASTTSSSTTAPQWNEDAGAPPCQSNADCSGGRLLCDPTARVCVQCVYNTDCGSLQACVLGACTTYPSCASSLGCPADTVCNGNVGNQLGVCVQCSSSFDCSSAQTCVGRRCLTLCQSDKTCTPSGMLCNTVSGVCVGCIRDSDCPQPLTQHCSSNTCVPDVCTKGGGFCQANTLYVCNASGSGYALPVDCDAGVCTQTGGTATCGL